MHRWRTPCNRPACEARRSLNHSARTLALLGTVLVLGACDIPTEPPKLQPRFVLPAASTTLRLTELLPADVTEAGSNFRLAMQPITIPNRTLGQMCGTPCTAVNGMRVPKPAFTDTVQATLALPGDVVSAELASGSIDVSFSHNLGFDPLRPPGSTQNGSLAVTLLEGGRVVGSVVITDPFPDGAPLIRTIGLAAGTIASDLTLRAVITSPAGGSAEADWVSVNTSAALGGTAAPGEILVAAATVRVQDKTVNVADFNVDLADVDAGLKERVIRGALVVTANNPFDVTGTLQMRISAGTLDLINPRTLQVGPGVTTQRIEFEQDELNSILGSEITVRLSGTVSGTDGTVTVQPGQVLEIETHLDLTLEIG
jgi:hypothetical protein